MHTTLKAIRAHSPCEDGWRKLLAHLGKTRADDEPLLLSTILESNGMNDALWCLRSLPSEYENAVRLLVCDLVEPSLAFVPEGEDRPRQAVETARRFARGEATAEELADASRAVSAAAWAAVSAAAHAAWAARAAAYAAMDARDAAGAARAAYAAADVAAWDAARAAQEQTFRAWLAKMEGKSDAD